MCKSKQLKKLILSEITYFPGGKLGEVLPQGAGGGVDQVGARRETKIQQDILKVFFSFLEIVGSCLG